MKKLQSTTVFFLLCLSLFTFTSQGQNHSHHDGHNHDDEKKNYIANKLKSVQLNFDKDSLLGFNELDIRQSQIFSTIKEAWESSVYLSNKKRHFINQKYSIGNFSSSHSSVSIPPSVQAPCTNVDFETGTAAGWTFSEGDNTNSLTQGGCCPNATTRFQVVGPGADPQVAALQRVPPGGGNFALRLGDGATTGGYVVRARQTFNVTAANSVFIYKFAVVLEDAGDHDCNEQAYFNISFLDNTNNDIACSSYNVVNSGNACSSGDPSFVTSGIYKWKDWTTRSFDLTPYIGQNVTIEFTAGDCTLGGHAGWAYVDASCQPMTLNLNGFDIPVGQTNSFICAASSNTLCAPDGFTAYTWTGPGGATGQTTRCVAANTAGTYSVTLGMAGSSCNSPLLYSSFNLVLKPIADFNFTVTPCLTTFTVPFSDNSGLNGGPPISSHQWTWGDASPNGTNANETHTFVTPGNKNVKLKISNGGCVDSITKPITITAKPVVDFNTQNNCLGVSSTFTSISTPTSAIAAQVWHWGDATANGFGTPSNHLYANSGTFNVKLVVTSTDLCKDSITKPITIHPRPVISFTANPVCLGTSSSFNNTSTILAPSTVTNWAWDFENNGSIDNTAQNPTTTYTASGNYVVELKASSNQGCSDSLTRTIRVNANPTATFSPVNACLNTNVLLNNTSTIPLPDNIVLYTWNFGAGSIPATSSNQNPPSLTYNSSGVKTITLTLTANTTCTSTVTRTVEVYPQPVANFSTSSVCQGTSTAYTDLSTPIGSITGWDWDFTTNNSVDNSTQNPSLTFPASGTFTTSLIATSSVGCKDTIVLPVNVWGRSIPNFSPDNVCYGTATTFTNLTNVITNPNVGGTPTYDWDFADGTPVSNLTNPSHVYTLGGNSNAVYNVTLTATTTNNCVDQIVKQVRVFALPTASFTANEVCLGTPTSLSDASNGNGNVLNNFIWDFLSNGTVDVSGVSNPNFTFPNYGINLVTYTVSTTPTVGLTCSNTTNTISVLVNPNPVPDFTFANRCINAQPVNFDASSSSIAVGTNTNYAWAYGNGLTNLGINTSHTYATPAVYNATLIVTSDRGCQTSIVKPVTIYPKPIMNIVNTLACDQTPVSFTGASLAGSGTVTEWYWDFNNSNTSFEAQGQNVNYVFPAAGDNTVTLISVTNNGCRDTITKPLYVDYVPIPEFSVNRPSGCPIHCVEFTDQTPAITGPGQNATWKWVLGDGTVVTNNSGGAQSHCYNNNTSNSLALFDVKLVVTTDRGCSDSLTKSGFVTVYPTPIANYDATPNPGNVVTPLVQFNNQSSDYTKFWWFFGDGPLLDTVNVNPSHLYSDASANIYNTSLIVQNQYGCRDTAYLKIEIAPEYTFYIPNAFTPGDNDGINDYFTGKGIGIEKFEMWIYDRWGEMIFYSNDITKGWDGKVQGKPLDCKQDVYVWKVKVKDVLGKKHDYVGHVTLLR